MTAPGPTVTSGGDTQPGADSLFPTGFGGGGASVRAGGVGTTELADGSVAAADVNLASVGAALAAHSTFTGTYTRLLTTDTVSTAASGTLVAWHLTPVDATSGSATWTLPAAGSVVAGVEVAVKKADTSTNTVTVNRAGSDLIFGTGSGTTSKTLTLAGEAITFVSDGTSRWTIQTSDTPSGVLASTYAKKPWVDVRDYGVVADGVTDDTAAMQAAIAALNGKPGTVWVPVQNASIGISAPLTLALGQNLVGAAVGGSFGSLLDGRSPTIGALPSFTGTAMIMSSTWTGGGDPNNYWHWGSVDNIRIDCQNVAPIGIAIWSMGENATIRRVIVLSATDSCIVLAGAHAPVTLENVNVSNATNYGLKLTVHPTYSGNSGAVNIFGISGDNNLGAHLYTDGSHSITLAGWKSESHFVGVQISGTQAPNVFATGYFNTGRATPDLFKVSGSAAPRIVSMVRTNGVTNHINDTVNSRTVPTSLGTVPCLVTYGGKNILLGPTAGQRLTQTRTGNGSVTVDASLGDYHEVTLAGNATSTTISNPTTGQRLTLTFIQDGTGGRTYAWPTATYFGGAAPANITTASRRESVTMVYDGSGWYEVGRSQTISVSSITPARSGRWLTAPTPASQTSNGTFSVGSLRYMPVWFDRASTVTDIGIWIPTGNATATIRLGLYADNDGQPTGAALVDSGALDASVSSTFKSVSSLTQAVNPGRYWVAAVSQTAAATCVGVLGVSNGIAPSASYAGSDITAWIDSASTTSTLPSANPSSVGRGMLVNVKVA